MNANIPTTENLRDVSTAWLDKLRRKTAQQRVPVSGMLELTSRCNLRCVHCYLGPQSEQQLKRDAELSTCEVKEILQQAADAGCLYLTITGGDPMMRKDFIELYRHACTLGMFITVFCDGILAHDAVLDVFRELPPRLVEVSLYGATAETYESVTRVKGSFKFAVRGIDRLVANGTRVGLKTVLLKTNRHELSAMEAFAAERSLPFRFDGAVFPCLPNGDKAPIDERLPASVVVAAEMADPARRKAWRKRYREAQRMPVSDAVYTCGAGETSFYIDPLGRMSPCVMTPHHGRSLREASFAEIWNEDIARVRALRYNTAESGVARHLEGACVNCPGVNRLETGSEQSVSPFTLELAELRREAILEKE